MTDEEVEEATKIANSILEVSGKRSPRRITITEDVVEAFDLLWGLYTNADEGTEEEWMSEEERKKLSKLHDKIHGK